MKVLAKTADVKPDKGLGVYWLGHLDGIGILDLLRRLTVGCNVADLPAVVATHGALVPLEEDILAKDTEVGLVCCKCEHDKVRIETVHGVASVRVPVGVTALPPDPVDNLVLSLTGNRRVRNDDLELCASAAIYPHVTYVLPSWVVGEFLRDPVLETRREEVHEGSACTSAQSHNI